MLVLLASLVIFTGPLPILIKTFDARRDQRQK